MLHNTFSAVREWRVERDGFWRTVFYESRFAFSHCRIRRSPKPLIATVLYWISRAGRGGGRGRFSKPLQLYAVDLWSGVLISFVPLRGGKLQALRRLAAEMDTGKSKVDMCSRCGNDAGDNYFDRSLCPCDDVMHTRCVECSFAYGECAYEETK